MQTAICSGSADYTNVISIIDQVACEGRVITPFTHEYKFKRERVRRKRRGEKKIIKPEEVPHRVLKVENK
jgi:ABC-type histidine transport system ATPase subunit